jgi:hypothetical protein
MGKQAREARRLAEQAGIATDLSMLQTRPFLLAGVEIAQVNMMTPLGNSPGAKVIFHMQNGDVHPPIILDPIAALNVIASIASTILGHPAPGTPGANTEPEPQPEPTITESGIILA